MRRQPLEIQTLYAELIERLIAFETRRTIGHAPGSFVTKTIKGETYYYFQHSEPGGRKRQTYVGKRDAALDRVVARYHESREDVDAERRSVARLAALLRTGGALVTDAASARVLRALADAGVFHLGGVLVGTHAFTAIGNLLGVAWEGGGLRTQDIDIAAEKSLAVAIGDELAAGVPDVLESLEMGFVPTPGLDPDRPSTSFVVRGEGLRVDVLTPMHGRPADAPVRISRFGVAAQPIRFLDYATESPERAAIINGGGMLVSVPAPARFGLHKLIVAGERPVTTHVKRDKDVLQAAQVLSVLLAERAGDIAIAWEALESRGPGWLKRGRRGVALLAEHDAELAAGVADAAGFALE